MLNTRDTNDDDAQGMVLSFKAYPWGRWYGEPKTSLVTGLSSEDMNLISLVYQHHVEKNAFLAAPAPAPTPNDNAGEGDDSTAQSEGSTATKSPDELPKLSTAVAEKANAMLRNTNTKLKHETRMLLQAAINDQVMTADQMETLKTVASTPPAAPKWHIVEERDTFMNRFSVFHGRSISNFNSGGLSSEVNVIGVGFDVSPYLCLLLGQGLYEVDDGGGHDSDSSLFFGISLNLYSFKALGSALAGME